MTAAGVDFFQWSAPEMYAVIMEKLPLADIVIKAAAVGITGQGSSKTKIKGFRFGNGDHPGAKPDILKEIGAQKETVLGWIRCGN